MNILKISILVLVSSLLISNICFCDEEAAFLSGQKPIEEFIAAANVDYFNNGTLYSSSIHHSRPAVAISETKDSREAKSLAENISYSFSSSFLSRYVSHSIADSQGWVWQPAATVEWYGLGFNVWSNFVIEDKADRGTFNEVDLTIYYDYKFHGLTIHPYFTADIYPTNNKLSLDYSSNTDVLPSLHLSYALGPLDIFADLELYVHPNPGALKTEVGVGLTQKIVKNLAIETSGLVGIDNSKYNKAQFNVSDTTCDYFTYSIAFPWNPLKGLVIKPTANVSAFLQKDLRDATRYPVQVWGGLNFAYHL